MSFQLYCMLCGGELLGMDGKVKCMVCGCDYNDIMLSQSFGENEKFDISEINISLDAIMMKNTAPRPMADTADDIMTYVGGI